MCSGQLSLLPSAGCSVLCAVSKINQTTSVGDLPDDNVPAEVRCAKHCSALTSCHSFNYRSDIYALIIIIISSSSRCCCCFLLLYIKFCSDIYACLFFFYPPTNCRAVLDCLYYQVTKLITSKIVDFCVCFRQMLFLLTRFFCLTQYVNVCRWAKQPVSELKLPFDNVIRYTPVIKSLKGINRWLKFLFIVGLHYIYSLTMQFRMRSFRFCFFCFLLLDLTVYTLSIASV